MNLRRLLISASVGLIDWGLEESRAKIAGVDAVDVGRLAMFGGSLGVDILATIGVLPRDLIRLAEDVEIASLPLAMKSGKKYLVSGFRKLSIPSVSPQVSPQVTARQFAPSITNVTSY